MLISDQIGRRSEEAGEKMARWDFLAPPMPQTHHCILAAGSQCHSLAGGDPPRYGAPCRGRGPAEKDKYSAERVIVKKKMDIDMEGAGFRTVGNGGEIKSLKYRVPVVFVPNRLYRQLQWPASLNVFMDRARDWVCCSVVTRVGLPSVPGLVCNLTPEETASPDFAERG